MSLFLNTSTLHNHYQDCCTIDVGETIERDCLSVLHKLHDQVNGLQLVQVVVQPLARLFNPASLAALANVSSTPQSINSNNPANVPAQSNVTTPTSQHPSGINQDFDGLSINTGISSTNLSSSGHNNHSRSQSFASAFNSSGNQNSNSLLSASSTYMMSPDTAQALISRLDTDRDVNWLMEIIGYGLSMPFSLTGEQDSVKDCCTIYCEWLASALLPYNEQNEDGKYQQLSKLVPVPIRTDPNRYARKMLSHLYNVFLPRQSLPISGSTNNQKDHADATLTAVSRQAVLCHRVLRTIENIAQNPKNLMDNQTWDRLLALLLTVNDKLLSAPTEPDDIGTQLHDRILGVLFELMLFASAKSIPTPSLWKTFHEMCLNWRHRPALVDHWRRITLLLTKRIVQMPVHMRANRKVSTETDILNQENYSNTSSNNANPCEFAIASMNCENVSQTWYRFLNLIGNPVELSDPNTISKTDEFYHSACASDNVLDPRQHPCLSVLPQIFVNSMAGLRDFIEAFLGTYQLSSEEQHCLANNQNRSNRGSTASLTNNNLIISSGAAQPNANNLTQVQQPQPQAATSTQNRRTGVIPKGIKGAKVVPFSPPYGSQPNALSPSSDFGQEHTKHGSTPSSSRQQLNQPKLSLTSLSSHTSQTSQQQAQFKLSIDRPKCNSLLHIFGDWLFSAALVGSDLNQEVDELNDGNTSEEATSVSSSSTATEISGSRSYSPSSNRKKSYIQKTAFFKNRQQSHLGKDSAISGQPAAEKITLDPQLSADSFEFGQAEAMAILCKIFSSKSSCEDISPTYLSRFYLCLQHCLTFGCGQEVKQPQAGSAQTYSPIRRQLLASVLVNSTTLLQKDLDGINLLIPSFIKAIEFVFECSEKDAPVQPPPRQHSRSMRGQSLNTSNKPVTNYDLRRACILTLVNLLAYPFYFQDLAIRNCLNNSSPTTTFRSLRPRLLKLLFVAMQTESDPTNMQILFGGLSLTIHDLSSNSYKQSNSSKNASTRSRHKTDSTSSSNTGNDSSHNSLEISRQDDTTSQSSFVFDSSGGFLVKSLHVTCHLLINIWKHDTQVSLAALELLTTIARVSTSSNLIENNEMSKSTSKFNNNNNRIDMKSEYKQTTKWICDYICNQCSRPPPAHSRDMHSTIVAAYQCLSVWFYNHPYLLSDQNCVATLMEVIELGVSGQKSKLISVNPTTGATAQSVVSKYDKIMKPSSMRVREAAESLLNICMVKARFPSEGHQKTMSCYDTVLDEQTLAELFGGIQYKTSARHIQDMEQRQLEPFKLFKYFSDEDSVVFGMLEGLNHDPTTKDSVICLLRTPFGKHCWKMKFNYYTEKSREKIIANKTLGLIKRPFQCTTPNSETRIFPFPSGQNKSLYINNSAKFFPEAIENLPANDLDKLVTSLDDYVSKQPKDSKLHNDLDKIKKIFSHQVLAEQKVISECSIRVKKVECEEPQSLTDLEAARVVATHLGLKSSLNALVNDDKVSQSFVSSLKSLDCLSVRTCDSVGIFYVRKNRTNPREILESVRSRHNVSLAFFEWLLELGHPVVVKNHCRWTGKISNSWSTRAILQNGNSNSDTAENQATFSRNQMLASDHGGAIFDGERMTLYWSDMCQELAFLVPHKIERASPSISQDSGQATKTNTLSEYDLTVNSSGFDQSTSGPGFELNSDTQSARSKSIQDSISSQLNSNQDQNSDSQSLCSVTSDTSSHSTRPISQQSSPRDHSSVRDQKDSTSLSRHSISTQKKKSTSSSYIVGCDTNIIICWLECSDDIAEIPRETLLSISENGYLLDDGSRHSDNESTNSQPQIRARDYVEYFISPMKNGLYRVNLTTSFGRQWLALPLVDGMTISKGILSSLIRESVLNLCRRRRLDADCYQPPHVRRRLKIQDICNSHRISSRYESAEFYGNLFKTSKPS